MLPKHWLFLYFGLTQFLFRHQFLGTLNHRSFHKEVFCWFKVSLIVQDKKYTETEVNHKHNKQVWTFSGNYCNLLQTLIKLALQVCLNKVYSKISKHVSDAFPTHNSKGQPLFCSFHSCVSRKAETMRNTWNLIAFISVLYITMMLIYLQKI